MEVSIIRRILIIIKVNKSNVDLFTKNAEPDLGPRSGFVFSDKLISSDSSINEFIVDYKGKLRITPMSVKVIMKSSSLQEE